VPTYTCKDKTAVVSGAGPKGEAIGPISFKSGSYTTKDEAEAYMLDHLALDGLSIIQFDQEEAK
jgi:hypothetical protein